MSENFRDSETYQQYQADLEQKIKSLCQQPSQRESIKMYFENLLRDVSFFEKPDIIPHANLDQVAAQTRNQGPEKNLVYSILHKELEIAQRESKFYQVKYEELEKKVQDLMNRKSKTSRSRKEDLELQISRLNRELARALREIQMNKGNFGKKKPYEIQTQHSQYFGHSKIYEQTPSTYQNLQQAYILLGQSYNKDLKELQQKIKRLQAQNAQLLILVRKYKVILQQYEIEDKYRLPTYIFETDIDQRVGFLEKTEVQSTTQQKFMKPNSQQAVKPYSGQTLRTPSPQTIDRSSYQFKSPSYIVLDKKVERLENKLKETRQHYLQQIQLNTLLEKELQDRKEATQISYSTNNRTVNYPDLPINKKIPKSPKSFTKIKSKPLLRAKSPTFSAVSPKRQTKKVRSRDISIQASNACLTCMKRHKHSWAFK